MFLSGHHPSVFNILVEVCLSLVSIWVSVLATAHEVTIVQSAVHFLRVTKAVGDSFRSLLEDT